MPHWGSGSGRTRPQPRDNASNGSFLNCTRGLVFGQTHKPLFVARASDAFWSRPPSALCDPPGHEGPGAVYPYPSGRLLWYHWQMALPPPSPGELLSDPLLGKTIAGRFTIKAFLGQGASGKVYLADQHTTGREIALKLLSLEKNVEPKAQERFAREARIAARLSHPNTITVYDSGQDGELHFIAMEYLSGQPLSLRIKEGPLSPQAAIQITLQILASLEDAHQQGIVHRDLKPENIFLSRRGTQETVKVLDFGIAKARRESGLTTEGTTYGTPHYMSPEQCCNEELDGRADLYSVGVILYEMLCGERPFQGNSSMEIASKQLNVAPPSLFKKRASLRGARALVQVVERAMSKNKEKRFANAKEMSQALHAAQAQLYQASKPAPLSAWIALGVASLGFLAVLGLRLLSSPSAALRVTAPSGTTVRINGQAPNATPLQQEGLTAGSTIEVELLTTSGTQKMSLSLTPGLNTLTLQERP